MPAKMPTTKTTSPPKQGTILIKEMMLIKADIANKTRKGMTNGLKLALYKLIEFFIISRVLTIYSPIHAYFLKWTRPDLNRGSPARQADVLTTRPRVQN